MYKYTDKYPNEWSRCINVVAASSIDSGGATPGDGVKSNEATR